MPQKSPEVVVELLQVLVRKSVQRELQLICVIKSLNGALPASGSRPASCQWASPGHSQRVLASGFRRGEPMFHKINIGTRRSRCDDGELRC